MCGFMKLNDAQRHMVEDHLWLVDYIISRYTCYIGLETEGKRSIGYLALCEAVASYDPNHGAAFSTYAGNMVAWRVKQWYKRSCAKRRGGNRVTISLNAPSMRLADEDDWYGIEEIVDTIPDETVDVEEAVLGGMMRKKIAELMPLHAELEKSGMNVQQFAKSKGLSKQCVYNRFNCEIERARIKLFGVRNRKENEYAYNL